MLVHFKGVRTIGFQDRIILPGINDLPPELVGDLQEDSIHALKFEKGEIEIIDKEEIGATKVPSVKKGKETTGIDVLLGASEGNAKALALKTVDMTILKIWYGKEKRVSVKKAIRSQIDKIENIKYRDEKKQKFEKSKESDEE